MSFVLDISNVPTPNSNVPLMDITTTQELNERVLARAYAMLAEAEREIARQRERIQVLENLSFCDELTGLANRRGFELALGREIAAVNRDPRHAGTLILIDLDGFKQINDTHGHAAGDAYLIAIADCLSNLLRETDCVARIGGDEFAVLLPHTKTSAGAKRAQTLQEQLNAAVMHWQGHKLPLRASFGVAHYATDDTISAAMKRADARLYSNKGQRKVKRSAVI